MFSIRQISTEMASSNMLARSLEQTRRPLVDRHGKRIVRASTARQIRLLAEALFASTDGPPPARRLDWLEREVEDYLARSGAQSRWVFSFLVWLLSWVAPLFIGRFRPLGALPLSERIRALTVLERRFGEPLLAVKAILCLIYYEHPDAASAVGFDGRCFTAGPEGRPPP